MQGLYHGRKVKNRNGTCREIDYKRETICLVSTNSRCWRPTQMKYLERTPYQTRQRAGLHKKVHPVLEYNVKEAIYDKDNLDISIKILSFKDV